MMQNNTAWGPTLLREKNVDSKKHILITAMEKIQKYRKMSTLLEYSNTVPPVISVINMDTMVICVPVVIDHDKLYTKSDKPIIFIPYIHHYLVRSIYL